MAHDNWRDVIADIDSISSTVTSRQKALAAIAGIDLPEDLPQLVAQCRLRAALAGDLGFAFRESGGDECSDAQLELIQNLKGDSNIDTGELNAEEARAWIGYLYLQARRRALENLQLEAGDIVEVLGSPDQLEQVSSIGGNGRIHFKGGAGAGAWPDRVIVRCKNSDQSATAQEMMRKALSRAALRVRVGEWTSDKHQELKGFEIEQPLAEEDIEGLYNLIEAADDEKNIQLFIEKHPQILGVLLGGNPRFCLSRPPLGGKYVPDFLVSDVDSLGVRWVLVELETPKSTVTLNVVTS